MRCCAGDEGCGPSASPCGGEASNHLELRWLKTVVVSVEENGARDASGGDREGERERTAADVSRSRDDIESRADRLWSGMSLAGAVYWPGGVRHEGGASPICGFCMDLGRQASTLSGGAASGLPGSMRWSAPGGGNCPRGRHTISRAHPDLAALQTRAQRRLRRQRDDENGQRRIQRHPASRLLHPIRPCARPRRRPDVRIRRRRHRRRILPRRPLARPPRHQHRAPRPQPLVRTTAAPPP